MMGEELVHLASQIAAIRVDMRLIKADQAVLRGRLDAMNPTIDDLIADKVACLRRHVTSAEAWQRELDAVKMDLADLRKCCEANSIRALHAESVAGQEFPGGSEFRQVAEKAREEGRSMYFTAKGAVRAAQLLRTAADLGDPEGMTLFADCLLEGRGVERVDAEGAVQLYRKALEMGHVGGKAGLARCLLDGLGVPRDIAAGFALAREAAEAGCASAMAVYARCHEFGMGVQPSIEEAVRWLTRGAAELDPEALCGLAACYRCGAGVEEDEAAAVRLYRRAAERGHVKAMCELAGLLEAGEGVPRDMKQAQHWWNCAAEAGSAVAAQERARFSIIC